MAVHDRWTSGGDMEMSGVIWQPHIQNIHIEGQLGDVGCADVSDKHVSLTLCTISYVN